MNLKSIDSELNGFYITGLSYPSLLPPVGRDQWWVNHCLYTTSTTWTESKLDHMGFLDLPSQA